MLVYQRVPFKYHWIGFLGKILTGNPWVFTMKYGAFRLKFSHHPILWKIFPSSHSSLSLILLDPTSGTGWDRLLVVERAIADFWSFGAQEANASQTQRGQLVKDQETLHGAIPNRTESIHKLFISAHACYPGNFRCSESEGPLKVPCQTLKPSIWSQEKRWLIT